PPDASFQKVTLNGAPGEPMALAVLPDGRVLHTARRGQLFMHDPATGFNRVIAQIPVYQHDEEGLQSLAIDADFAHNHWLYVYYSPPLDTPLDDPATPVNEGDAPEFGTASDFARFRGALRLSRFRLNDDELDVSSEQIILQVPVDRGQCCHVGGHIDFDRDGNLLLSTGDDTNPFQSDGFAPIDERADRNPVFDAQRSSANTNDLRGKLLRIRVRADGSYSIPRGNLFRPGTPKTRPEIYLMGLRNPFRFAADRRSDVVYLADYSPDSPVADPLRGPSGTAKWMVVREPGNYGWPYCATPELPYIDYDFATGTSGAAFDCRAPINDSPHNTGRRHLPPVTQPDVWYGSGPSAQFPELGTGGVAPMGGPAYHYRRDNRSSNQWPRYFDGVPIFYEWSRDRLFEFRLDRRGRFDEIRPLLASIPVDNPIDMQFGPDGALYVLEYGDGFNLENPEAKLARIDYVRGNFTPVPVVTASAQFGFAPLTVQLSSEGTLDPDGDALTLEWDFDADGVVDSTEANTIVTYATNGVHTPTLRATDSTGRSGVATARIVVGNTPPLITFLSPAPDLPFEFGDTVDFELTVADDTAVDCGRVSVEEILVHDQHGHSLSTVNGCSGSFTTQLDAGHAGAADLFIALRATYTDAPTAPGAPPLTSVGFALLFPPLPEEPEVPVEPGDAAP
ncbi:MAG TPA: PQQ-dependent sugar dehydrogenase, partial [Polyangiaceae bacterium]|nr:PQQ-dependent sugar dehydrogenase [Polyangiaceae bacterium]